MEKSRIEVIEGSLQGAFDFEMVCYDGDKEVGLVEGLTLDPEHDTIWANTEQLSKLFGRSPKTINEHLRNIFSRR